MFVIRSYCNFAGGHSRNWKFLLSNKDVIGIFIWIKFVEKKDILSSDLLKKTQINVEICFRWG